MTHKNTARSRRGMLAALGLGLAGCAALPAHAADEARYPSRPVKLLVGFVAGGAVDAIGRDLAKSLGDIWKQSVVVENKGGASGTIAAAATVNAPADGYTLLLTSDSALVSAPFINDKLSYDPLADLKPIALVSGFPLLFVANSGLKVKSLRELIAAAKAAPNKIAYASTGIGTSSHLPMEQFQQLADIKLNHIPYKGGSQAMNELVGGTVPLMLTTYALAAPHVETGKLVALAVGSPKRLAQMDSVPTFTELGFPAVEAGNWIAVLGPKGMSDALVRQISTDLATVVKSSQYKERMFALGFEPRLSTPAELSALIRKDYDRNKAIFSKLDAKPE